MLYEKKKKPQVSYSSDEIVEWNINGLTEYQNSSIKMVVCYTAYTCRDIIPCCHLLQSSFWFHRTV